MSTVGEVAALETKYDGCVFRSRTEARWAVFFNACEIPWEYEKEGYKLGSELGASRDFGVLYYLPDFWLPSIQTWVEVRGMEPDAVASEKAYRLGYHTKHSVIIFVGAPRLPNLDSRGNDDYSVLDGGIDYDYWWCQCLTCGKVGIQFEGRGDRICGHKGSSDKGYNHDTPLLRYAFAEARSARFTYDTWAI